MVENTGIFLIYLNSPYPSSQNTKVYYKLSSFNLICAWIYKCVLMTMCWWCYMWKPEINCGCYSLGTGPPCSLRQNLSPDVRLGWLASKHKGPAYLSLSSLELQHRLPCLTFLLEPWRLNSGSQSCREDTLFTKLFPLS